MPRARLARCRDLPAFFGGLNKDGGILFDTSWYDPHLWCETTMGGARELEEPWLARGLGPEDFCIAHSGRGATRRCGWLEHDAADNCVWLKGEQKGALIGGAEQLRERADALLALVEQAERSYSAMYEARRPRDDYDDACGGLMRATDIARFLHRADEARRLEKRLEQISAVYNSQFRGF